jgi:nitrogen fixation/metabolism regulation signal transduction histidine kinase
MASDTFHPILLPLTWRVLLALGLAVVAVHLLATTQYYATIFLIALLILTLMFGLARLLQENRSTADIRAANLAITRLQSEQKRTAQAQDYLQALLDTVSAALLVLESDGRITAANRAARLLTGAEGPRLCDIRTIGPEAAASIARLQPCGRTVLRLANGQQMLASAGQFAGDGASRRLISLQAVAGELDAVQLKAWEDMSRVLAHEIMNSLTPIASLSESLSGMMRQEGASTESVGAIDTIARRSQGLAGFVTRYRQMAELPEPALETVPLQAFADSIKTLMQQRLEGIRYASRIEAKTITADPDLLSQAVINLLHNAADAVAGLDDPAIELACMRDGDAVVIAVTDNGKGVPAEFAEDIFVPFFTTKSGGSGIGLAIVRQIALKHGGRVEAENTVPRGAVFKLVLPH